VVASLVIALPPSDTVAQAAPERVARSQAVAFLAEGGNRGW
jgi:hypothetical protein